LGVNVDKAATNAVSWAKFDDDDDVDWAKAASTAPAAIPVFTSAAVQVARFPCAFCNARADAFSVRDTKTTPAATNADSWAKFDDDDDVDWAKAASTTPAAAPVFTPTVVPVACFPVLLCKPGY
jgi:hypothetical protein